jgi:hypothetical protein
LKGVIEVQSRILNSLLFSQIFFNTLLEFMEVVLVHINFFLLYKFTRKISIQFVVFNENIASGNDSEKCAKTLQKKVLSYIFYKLCKLF